MFDFLFEPIANFLGLPLDQARYVLLLFISIPVAMAFRHVLHPSHTTLVTRHIVSTALGVFLCLICFNLWNVLILIAVVTVSYIILHIIPPSSVHRWTMVWAMGTLSIYHMYRLVTDWGGYHLDLSGPMMILAQKISLVGYATHDGMGRNKNIILNKDQKKQKLISLPSVLEYFSYALNFHSILIGPGYTMREHLDFMDGSNLKPLDNPNQFARAKEHSLEPSPLYPVGWKSCLSLAILPVYISLSSYPVETVLDPSVNFFRQIFNIMVVAMRIKLGFYFIWILTDSINNAVGLGFNGYDESTGNAKWDLTTNIFILDMELATNPRGIASSWNITTARWLRRVCYERVTWQRSHMTFLLSAFWHGFYPSYYAALIYLGFVVECGKKMRRLFNPFFTSHGLAIKWAYHVITWFLTHVCAYVGAITLRLMWLPDVYLFWKSLYFIPIVMSVIIVLFVPTGRSSTATTKQKAVTEVAMSNGKIRLEKPEKQD